MYFLLLEDGFYNTEIGQLAGGRDHSTISYGVKMAKKRIRASKELSEEMEKRGIDVEGLAENVHEQRLKDRVEMCSKAIGIPYEDIIGKDTSRVLSEPRQMIYFYLKNQNYSFSEIGRAMGNRNHATIMHGCEIARDVLLLGPDRKKWEKALSLMERAGSGQDLKEAIENKARVLNSIDAPNVEDMTAMLDRIMEKAHKNMEAIKMEIQEVAMLRGQVMEYGLRP